MTLQELQDMKFADFQKKREEERDTNAFGVIAAPVGSGKTYCMLALCMMDKYAVPTSSQKPTAFSYIKSLFGVQDAASPAPVVVSGATMIVVPSHLFHQWEQAIKDYTGNGMHVHLFNQYNDIMKVYNKTGSQMLQESDIFLVSSAYYQTVATALVQENVIFKRLIIDEADNMQNMLRYACPATMTWFVSASIKAIIGKDGLQVGGFTVQPSVLKDHLVDCEPAFIEASFALPPIQFEKITCTDVLIDGIFNTLLSAPAKAAVQACDGYTATHEETKRGVHCTGDVAVAKALIQGWDALATDIENLQFQDDESRSQSKFIRSKIDAMKRAVDGIMNDDIPFDKIDEIMRICRNNTKKTIIFSTYPRVITRIADHLKEEGIPFATFEGGTAEQMAKDQLAFTSSQDVNLLLMHSETVSCGSNLQATERILFTHATPKAMRDQVIGRGQRPGRTGPLTVTDVYYANEM